MSARIELTTSPMLPSSRSPHSPDDALLLSDATTGVTATYEAPAGDATAASKDLTATTPTQPSPPLPTLLPPLNLSMATTLKPHDVAATAPLTKSRPSSQAPSSRPPPRVPPHKSSFSMPPSSRAAQTFSVLETDPSDALHARTANYETLLRQFSLHRSGSSGVRPRRMFRPPSVTAATYTRTGSRSAASTAPTGRLHRTSSAEDLRFSLTRLGSSFSLNRIRRGSNESVHATSAPATANASGGTGDTNFYYPHGRRRLSLSRAVRRVRHRFQWFLWGLTQPLSPLGPAYMIHQIAVLVAIAVQLFYTPFVASFLAFSSDTTARRAMVDTNVALEIAWLVDVALRFNTARMVESGSTRTLITSRADLARRYVRGAFVIDLFAVLPLETVFGLSSSHALVDDHAVVFHVGNALRLLTLRRASESIRAIADYTREWQHATLISAKAVLQVAGGLLVTTHYVACAWHAVLHVTPDQEDPPTVTNSISQSYVHALIEMSLLLVGDGTTAFHTMHSHNGDTFHASVLRDTFVMTVIVLGVMLSAVVFARLAVALLLAALHARENDPRHALDHALTSLQLRMTKLEFSPALQLRVRQYVTHVWETTHIVPPVDLLPHTLSPPLALEIALSRYSATLCRLPLWKGCSADLLSVVLVRVVTRVYLKDDFVRRKGECTDEMLLVQRGVCEFMVAGPSSTPPSTQSTASPHKVGVLATAVPPERLGTGAALGQLALLVDYKFPAYVRATSPVEVAVLSRGVFEELLNRFVDDRTGLVRRVLRRGLELNECPELTQLAGLSSSTTTTGTEPFKGAVTTTTMDATPSVRDSAKRVMRLLGVDALARHEPLRLPLSLEPLSATSASRRATSNIRMHRSASLQRTYTPERTAAVEPSYPPDAMRATTTGATTRRPELDALAQTHETLLQLVQHLGDTAARLDAKLSRMEERVHRAEDSARFATSGSHTLIRRRSSQRESVESVGHGLRRRASHVTTTSVSESSFETSRDIDATLQVPRLLLPEEIAALRATAAIVAEVRSSHAEAPAEGAALSTFDEDALDWPRLHVDPSISTTGRIPIRRAFTRSPHSMQTTGSLRSRSLGTSTRHRLAAFQQVLAGSSTASTTTTAPGTAEPSTRRPSLSVMWSRMTASPTNTGEPAHHT